MHVLLVFCCFNFKGLLESLKDYIECIILSPSANKKDSTFIKALKNYFQLRSL